MTAFGIGLEPVVNPFANFIYEKYKLFPFSSRLY